MLTQVTNFNNDADFLLDLTSYISFVLNIQIGNVPCLTKLEMNLMKQLPVLIHPKS